MKFSLSFSLLALVTPAVAIDGSVRADSKLGKRILGKARQLENNNYAYYSWIGTADLKFDGCASIPMFEREEGLRANLVAKFKLCPNGSCRNAGEYIVEMREFVETYQDALQESREYECEYYSQICENSCQNGANYYNNDGQQYDNYDNANNYNNNYNYNNQNNQNNGDDEEYCVNACLSEKGYDYCAEEEGEQELNEFAECQPMNEEEGGNNQNNYAYGSSDYTVYYTGAYCTSSGVYAGVFTDSTCTKHAPKGTYEKMNYGYSLPTQPLVSSASMSCAFVDNNNDGNNNNNNNNNNKPFKDRKQHC
mmetsp:Transcript_9995/g.24950  ORF Transcript_9995/g.24950 Transcript_9995/m.24950 type:complete len:308 (+) Transcript_9995:76-999(+)